jgi:hypothetical protein
MARRDARDADDVPRGDVERVQGHGIIRHGAAAVDEADYDVIITPAHLRGTAAVYEAGLSGDSSKTTPDITGRLMEPLYKAQPFANDVHTLVLEDGREFDFRVLQPDTNEIVGVSSMRAPSPSPSQ